MRKIFVELEQHTPILVPSGDEIQLIFHAFRVVETRGVGKGSHHDVGDRLPDIGRVKAFANEFDIVAILDDGMMEAVEGRPIPSSSSRLTSEASE